MAVDFSSEGAVGFITLDKPPANSYDYDFMEEMGAAVDAAAADDSVKVVIVRSASKKFFCAGADIKAFLANDTAGNMKMISRGHEVLASIAQVPKVFIAQIEGHALGGGLEITLACDLRFGARGYVQARRARGHARPAARQRRHAAAAADHRRARRRWT